MRTYKNIKKLWILLAASAAVKVFSLFPGLVEKYYSRGIYIIISKALRYLFGWLPFSLGDLMYILLVSGGIYAVMTFAYKIFTVSNRYAYLLQSFITFTKIILWLYIAFNLLWGLNYNRLGIAQQLQLKNKKEYSTVQLDSLVVQLAHKVNYYRIAMRYEKIDSSFTGMQKQALASYDKSSATFPFLKYTPKSIKQPVFNTMGNYLGYGGYINPFTNEAQVGSRQPAFILPFTICHEMAHQLGYGSEDEANFVGYLTAVQAENSFYKYSAYVHLYRYANLELYYRDSTLAIKNNNLLHNDVKSDLLYARQFFTQYESRYEKYISKIYNQYLKANEQPQGIDTYSKVTSWLLAYVQSKNNL